MGHLQLTHRRRVLLYVVVQLLLGIIAAPLAVQVLYAHVVQFGHRLVQLVLDVVLPLLAAGHQ